MWLIVLVTVVFAAILTIFFLDPFGFPKELIDAILPLAAFVLAYIAVLTITYSHMQTNKIRKRYLLIEIDEWARNGHKILSGYLPKQTWRDRNNTLRLLAEVNGRGAMMVNSAKLFGNDLSKEMRGAADDVSMFCKQLESNIEDIDADSVEYTNMDVIQEQCDKSLIRVFEITSNIRTKLRI